MTRISVAQFNELISNKILIYDGAMGTNLQTQGLSSQDFGGCDGCSEALVLFCPEAIKKVHRDFVKVGCQVIETNTFGATRITLKEYGLENRVAEINAKAVQLAKEAIDEAAPPENVLIAGSIGPTSMLPSLGNISFDDMSTAYYEQMAALWDAGVDIFQIETCQDLLQIKSALDAARKLFEEKKSRCVVVVSVTLESSGTMLVGSDISAITATLEPYDFIDVLSINCATGPLEMVRHVSHMVKNWPRAVAVMPNAGLPENVNGKPVYRMTPEEFAGFHKQFVEEFGINIVGGCCGTRPDHLEAVVKAVKNLKPMRREVRLQPQAASLFSAVSLRQKPSPAMVGERTNANGAKQFRDLLAAQDWEGMTAMGRDQARGGAHLVDLCVAYVGRDEVADIKTLVPMFATQVNLPLVIDSTSPAAIEAALKRHGGRCVINSVNLEDGGARLRQIAALAKRFGAALICLTIDEEGMAKNAPQKLAVAERIHRILSGEFGFRSSDLIFDPLTFTVGSGDVDLRNSAAETLKAISLVSQKFPQANTILGVSNVSFGLSPASREILNSVFLQEAVNAGLSCAIVNPAKLLPAHAIKEEERKLSLDLIYNPRNDGSELKAFMDAFARQGQRIRKSEDASLPDDERLKNKVIDGDASALDQLIKRLLEKEQPENIINQILLPAMKIVGELFGDGRLQLPFVLQSAEVVKKTVGLLEPFMEKKPSHPDRRMVLATVAGDVHDIGKNLVNIMLSNNGYKVFDLGIKVDISEMIKAAQDNDSRVIGMSGLLVRSTQIMKENLEELNRRDFLPAVILGGAALTADFVEKELKPLYRGRVFYARDAVDALKLMELLGKPGEADKSQAEAASAKKQAKPPRKVPVDDEMLGAANRHQFVSAQNIVKAPFLSSHLLEINSNELFSLLSHKVLFEGRWGFNKGSLKKNEYEKILEEKARPALNRFIEFDRTHEIFQAKAVYGYYRCRARKNQIRIFDDSGLTIGEFQFPRQAKAPHLCVADFISSETDDIIALWAVTLGAKVINEGQKLFKNDQYCDYHLLHGLGAELADCGAVHVHRHIHRELFNEPLTDNQVAGCRYSFGYPACPDLAAQKELLRILQAQRIGIELTELYQMVPELSVSGFILFNPHARYFVP
ncbi:MAG: methionine synthase [Candidatus Rifleibacteriota bacterium]